MRAKTCTNGRSRTTWSSLARAMAPAVVALAGLAGSATAAPQESVTFNNVDSNSCSGCSQNAIQTHTFNGTYAVGAITVSGTLNEVNTGTWASEARILVTPPSGAPFVIQPTTTGGFTTSIVIAPTTILVNAPSPVTSAAGLWTFRFYESLDDGGDFTTDATWANITITLDDTAPLTQTPIIPASGVYTEIEPNNLPYTGNVVAGFTPGNSIVGNTTGTVFTDGATSVDSYKITVAAASQAIYKNQITLTTSGTAGHAQTIRGLIQANQGPALPGMIAIASDTAQSGVVAFQTGITTPSRLIQWYGFGKGESLYYRVTGTTSTMGDYTATFSQTTVTPIAVTPDLYAGPVTISRGTGNTTAVDFWLYDSNLNPIADAGNQGNNTLTRTLAPGTYYLAVSNANTGNNLVSPADDSTRTGNVTDFSGIVVNSSTTTTSTNLNMNFASTSGTSVGTGSRAAAFEVVWYTFNVILAPGVAGTGTATPAAVAAGVNTDLKITVFPGGSGTLADIANPPQLSGVRVDVAQLTGNMSPDWLYLLQDGITADWKTTYMVPGSAPVGGPYSLPFEITQGGVSPSTFNGSIALTVTPPPPANDPCTGAENITAVPYTSALVDYFYATTDTNANPSCDSSSNTTGANRGVWWRYTASADGMLMVNRNPPTSEDTVTSVWTGADCNTLTQVVCTDTDGTPFNVPVVTGTTYYIMVSKWGSTAPGATVQVGVTVDFFVPPPPPANDPCSGAENITAVPYTSALVDYFYATTDTNANPSCDSSSNTTGANRGVWWKYTASANGTLMVNRDSPTSEDTATSVWTGADCNTLTEIACMDSDATPFAVPVVNGTTYYIMVSYWFSSAPSATDQVGLTVDFIPPPSPPANDACAGATVISAVPFDSGAISVGGAAADANVACNTGGATQVNNGIWFTYTPASNCTAALGETGTLDAIHAVYTGPDCNTLTEVQCFVNETGNTFAAAMGTQYYILVGVQGLASAGAASTMTVTLDCGQPPANDLCSGAVALTVGSTETVTSPMFATHDIDSTCNAGTETRFGVWFSYTTGADAGTLALTENSSNDVIFQVFSGDCNNLTPVACSDAEAPASFVLPQPNTTYYILMGMWSATTAPASDYSVTATAFTAVSGACCTGSSCSVGVLASACVGPTDTWLGANSTCATHPPSYEAPNVPVPDGDGGTSTVGVLERTLTVSGATGPITSVTVTIDYSHTWAGDNQIYLIAPDSTSAALIVRPGTTAASCDVYGFAGGTGSLNDFNGVYLISDAGSSTWAAAVVAGPSPLASGTYKASGCTDTPVSLNATFAASNPNGVWKLRIQDHGGGDLGTLRAWGLNINNAPDVGPCTPTTEFCCRGTTCNPVATGTCTGVIAGSQSIVRPSCGTGNAFASCCFADFNHDGAQSIDDLFLYFNAYFTGSPMADFGGDGTSQPTIDDLFLYINAYFGTCS